MGVLLPREMKRRFRVRSRGEFQKIYQEGRSFANRAAVLYVLPGWGGASRVGFAAGRKLGGAVVRNRVRRRLREALRLVWPRVRPGFLAVVIARPAAAEMGFGELCSRVAELIQRAGLLGPDAGGGKGGRPGG